MLEHGVLVEVNEDHGADEPRIWATVTNEPVLVKRVVKTTLSVVVSRQGLLDLGAGGLQKALRPSQYEFAREAPSFGGGHEKVTESAHKRVTLIT